MLRIFGGNNPFILILLPVIVAIFIILNYQFDYYPLQLNTDLGVWGKVSQIPKMVHVFVAPAIMLINALVLNSIFNQNHFLAKNSYYTSLLYVSVMSFNHCFYQISGIAIAHFLLIIGIRILFGLDQNVEARSLVFKLGICFGLAACFHPPLCVLIVLGLPMILVIRPVVAREMFLFILGFLIPVIYSLAFLYMKRVNMWFNPLIDIGKNTEKVFIFVISTGAVALLFGLSMLSIRAQMLKNGIRFKKMVSILWYYVILAIGLGAFEYVSAGRLEWFSYSAISLSLFLPFAFTYKSLGFFATVGFYLVVLISIGKFFVFGPS